MDLLKDWLFGPDADHDIQMIAKYFNYGENISYLEVYW